MLNTLAAQTTIPLNGWEIVGIVFFILMSLGLWAWSLISIHLWIGNGWVTGIAAGFSSIFLSGLTNGWASMVLVVMGIIGAFTRSISEGLILLILQVARFALLFLVLISAITRMFPGWETTITIF